MDEIVLVEWRDSYGAGPAWSLISEAQIQDAICFSVGKIVKENEKYILIVPHYHPEYKEIGAEESGCGDMTIPKCSIINITKLITSET